MTQQQELIPMATGEHLKQERLKRKLSLESVAAAIHLDEKVLADIEEERADRIAPVYLKGYLQSYARFLKIPEDDIRAMVDSSQSSDPALQNIFTGPVNRNPLDSWLRATSYVLASLLIGTLAWQFTHEAVRLSQNGPDLQEVTAAKPETGTQTQKVSGPVNASIATLGVLHGNSTGKPDPAAQAWASVSQPVLAEGESVVELRVSADSWVEISDSSGRELEMDLLRGGTDKSYHGLPPFRILIGRASAVHLYLDGEELDLAVFTRDDVAQFQWPEKTVAENGEVDGV